MEKNSLEISVKEIIIAGFILLGTLGNLGFSINRFVNLNEFEDLQREVVRIKCDVIFSEIASLTSRSYQLRSILEANTVGDTYGDSLEYHEYVQFEIINIESRKNLLENKNKEFKC